MNALRASPRPRTLPTDARSNVAVALALAAVAAGAGYAAMELVHRTSPFLVIAALAGICAITLAVGQPLYAVYLALAAIPLELLAVDVGGALALTPTEGSVRTGRRWMATSYLADGTLPFRPSPLTAPLGVFLLVAVPGLAIAAEPLRIVKFLAVWTMFYMAFNLLVAEGNMRVVHRILQLLIVSAGIVGLVAAVQSAGEQAEIVGFADQVQERAAGALTQPNLLGVFLLLIIPVAASLTSWRGGLIGLLVAAGLAAAVAALLLSLSRGALLGTAAALLVLMRSPSFRNGTLVAAGVAALLLAVGVNPVQSVPQLSNVGKRLQTLTGSSSGEDPRVTIFRTTPLIAAAHPGLGWERTPSPTCLAAMA